MYFGDRYFHRRNTLKQYKNPFIIAGRVRLLKNEINITGGHDEIL